MFLCFNMQYSTGVILVSLPLKVKEKKYSCWKCGWNELFPSSWKNGFMILTQKHLKHLPTIRNNHWRCSVSKCLLRNFAKFTRKHLYRSLFFNKVAGLNVYNNFICGKIFLCLIKLMKNHFSLFSLNFESTVAAIFSSRLLQRNNSFF